MKQYGLFFITLMSLQFHMQGLAQWEIKQIGQWIFYNETSGNNENVVHWHTNEPFPSLGICHCVWPSDDKIYHKSTSFSELCDFLKEHGAQLPQWLDKTYKKGNPWKTRDAFLKDRKKRKDLVELFTSTVSLQVQFMLHRLETTLPKLLKAVSKKEQRQLKKQFKLLQKTQQGTYALLDYLNFKGSGLSKMQNGEYQGWGLLQVLQAIPAGTKQKDLPAAFSLAAAELLLVRIKKTEPAYSLMPFFGGWMKRVATYADPALVRQKR